MIKSVSKHTSTSGALDFGSTETALGGTTLLEGGGGVARRILASGATPLSGLSTDATDGGGGGGTGAGDGERSLAAAPTRGERGVRVAVADGIGLMDMDDGGN